MEAHLPDLFHLLMEQVGSTLFAPWEKGHTSSSNPQALLEFWGSESLQKVNWLPGCSTPNLFLAQHAVSMSGNDADFSVTTCEIVVWSMVSIPMNTTLRFADACVFLDHHPIFQHFGTTKHFTNDQIIPVFGASSRVWMVSYRYQVAGPLSSRKSAPGASQTA